MDSLSRGMGGKLEFYQYIRLWKTCPLSLMCIYYATIKCDRVGVHVHTHVIPVCDGGGAWFHLRRAGASWAHSGGATGGQEQGTSSLTEKICRRRWGGYVMSRVRRVLRRTWSGYVLEGCGSYWSWSLSPVVWLVVQRESEIEEMTGAWSICWRY